MCLGAIPQLGLQTAQATSAAVSTATQVIGAGISAYGKYREMQAAKARSKYEAGVSKRNAGVAEMQAQDALKRGQAAEELQRKKTALIIGQQRAGFAGQGTEVGYGSPLDILGDTASAGELDALTIRTNAEREAWGYRNQQRQFLADEAISKSSAKSSAMDGVLGIGESMISGASQFSDKWASFRQQGIW